MENPVLEREDARTTSGERAAAAAGAGDEPSGRARPPRSAAPRRRPTGRRDVAVELARRATTTRTATAASRTPDTPTLRDHLLAQLSLTNLGERDRAFVDAADRRARRGRLPDAAAGGDRGAAAAGGRGRSRKSWRSRCATCSTSSPPASARARLAECLRLQLKTLPDERGARRSRSRSSTKHLELLASRDFTRLKSVTGADDDALRAAQRLIRSAQPAARRGVRQLEARYVDPRRDREEERATSGARASTPTPCRACASTACTPRSPPARAQRRHRHLLAAAGGALADQERAAALRHHPARVAGDRRAPAALPRARRGRDAPAGAARDRRDARACTRAPSRASPRRSSWPRRAAPSSSSTSSAATSPPRPAAPPPPPRSAR